MNRFIKIALVLITLTGVLRDAHGQGSLTFIKFQSTPVIQPGQATGTYSYYENGMWFKPIGGWDQFTRAGDPINAFWPSNGTGYVKLGLGDSLAFYAVDNQPFTVVSVDLAEFSVIYAEPRTIPFLGYKPDGSTVLQEFVLDGIIDGTGPIADFQTFYFGPDFAGVNRVEILTHRFALDNLGVIYVPEPSTSTLLLIAAAALATRRRLARQRH